MSGSNLTQGVKIKSTFGRINNEIARTVCFVNDHNLIGQVNAECFSCCLLQKKIIRESN